MKRSIYVLLMVIMAALALSPSVYAQQEKIRLEHDIFAKRERPGVEFSHAKHFETIDCLECHHFFVDGKNVWDESRETNCAACHKPTTQGRTMSLMKALHENCIGCHRNAKGGSKTTPVMCGECHVK